MESKGLIDKCRHINAVMMSDMAPQYFNTWEVFGCRETKPLWCAWHVDRPWKDGIRRHIQTSAQQGIYHQLWVLQMEMETTVPKLQVTSTVLNTMPEHCPFICCLFQLHILQSRGKVVPVLSLRIANEHYHVVWIFSLCVKSCIPGTQEKEKSRSSHICSTKNC